MGITLLYTMNVTFGRLGDSLPSSGLNPDIFVGLMGRYTIIKLSCLNVTPTSNNY